MDTPTGRTDVVYDPPVFVDDQNNTLESSCSPSGDFPVGVTQVTCTPMMSPFTPYNVKFQFKVNITGALD